MVDEFTERVKRLKKSVETAELMGNCLTKVLEFVESKGLGYDLTQYLIHIEDPYFMKFLKSRR